MLQLKGLFISVATLKYSHAFHTFIKSYDMGKIVKKHAITLTILALIINNNSYNMYVYVS